VIEEEDTIYGDGVNIAARLESLAEAGGICISEDVARQIQNKLDEIVSQIDDIVAAEKCRVKPRVGEV
jgi:class 3 adenylate cyclase